MRMAIYQAKAYYVGSFEGEIKFAAHHRIRKFQLKGKSQVKQFFRDFNIKRCCQQSCEIIFASDSKPIGVCLELQLSEW